MILLDLCKVREQIDAKVAEWREEGKAFILGGPCKEWRLGLAVVMKGPTVIFYFFSILQTLQ